jgi:undecaprenyl diphosphate synthase
MFSPNKTENLPQHVAIIMDGNGRWAARRRLPRIEGHQRGAQAARKAVETLIDYKIPFVTLFVFSTENWNRPAEEVESLFALLLQHLEEGLKVAMEKGARIRHLGSLEELPPEVREKMAEAVEITRENRNINLNLAFNYGARDEIVNAVRSIVKSGVPEGQVSQDLINQHLYSAGIPDPDLIIRTGGEMRLSNFLLWQAAYAEIYFTPVLWPDFGRKEMDSALQSYCKRQRRFGRLSPGEVKS